MSKDTFLDPEWFEEINRRFAAVTLDPDLVGERLSVRVVFEFADAPAALTHVMTFSVDERGARLDAVDHLAADLVVAISYLDAEKISNGQLRSSQALRDGLLKVRGDVNTLIQFSSWMSGAHKASSAAAK